MPNNKVLWDDTTTSGLTYVGRSELGRTKSSALWSIMLIENKEVKYPLNTVGFPSDKFEFIWDNRASLTYS